MAGGRDVGGMTDSETVLVTGGTGFVGPYVAELLLERGHEPVLYDVDADRGALDRLGIDGDVPIRAGDVSDPTGLHRAVHGDDVSRIVHLAVLREPRSDPRRAVDVNVGGTTNVLEAARTFDAVERVVVASTEEVYAPLSAYGTGKVSEDALVAPRSIYAAAKLYNERQADVFAEEYGVPAVALRPTGVYGPYRRSDESGVFRRLIERPALGEDVTVDGGDLLVSWLYVRDAARAFVDAAFAPEGDLSRRVYNVPGDVATVGEAAAVVEELVPDATVAVEGGGGEWSAQALDGAGARDDYGYDVEYDLRRGVAEYVNTIRADHGLDPVADAG